MTHRTSWKRRRGGRVPVGSARLKQALEVGPEHGDEVLVEIRFVRGGAVQGPGRGGEALQGGQGGRRARGAAVDVRAHLDAHLPPRPERPPRGSNVKNKNAKNCKPRGRQAGRPPG